VPRNYFGLFLHHMSGSIEIRHQYTALPALDRTSLSHIAPLDHVPSRKTPSPAYWLLFETLVASNDCGINEPQSMKHKSFFAIFAILFVKDEHQRIVSLQGHCCGGRKPGISSGLIEQCDRT
jgi:hypothetical protein